MNRQLALGACLLIWTIVWSGCRPKELPKVPPYQPPKLILNINDIAGNGQIGLANTTLNNQLKVRITDSTGTALENIPVYFGHNGIYSLTNQYGLASGSWVVGTCGLQLLDVYALQTDGNSSDTIQFTATLSNGTIHSATTMSDPRDGTVYNIATFGNQRWMLENLQYNISGSHSNTLNPSAAYGRLYTWDQANNACPAGWHLPTVTEYDSLMYTVLGCPPPKGLAASYKATTGWQNLNGDNHSSMNVYPAGKFTGGFQELGSTASFWTASEQGTNASTFSILDAQHADSYFYNHNSISSEAKTLGLSCRCVED